MMMIAAIASCSTGSKVFISEIEKKGIPDSIGDPVLRNLQKQNDLVIAFATENYAWIRNKTYLILCKNGIEWTGYNYKKDEMPNDKSYSLNEAKVNAVSCDSLLGFINKTKAWNIKGEDGSGKRCGDGNNNCNITDASSNSLWLTMKEKYTASNYYAAAFFEECCPGNAERKLFLIIGAKVYNIVSGNASSGETKVEY